MEIGHSASLLLIENPCWKRLLVVGASSRFLDKVMFEMHNLRCNGVKASLFAFASDPFLLSPTPPDPLFAIPPAGGGTWLSLFRRYGSMMKARISRSTRLCWR